MKANATRRILSLVIALAMMIAPMTFGVSASDYGVLSNDAVAVGGQDPYVPDPDGDIVSTDDVPFLERSADIARVDDLEPYEPDVDYIRGLPNEREELPLIPGESITAESRSHKLNVNPNATNRFYDNAYGDGAGEFTTKVVASSENAVIHLDTRVTNADVVKFATDTLLKEFDEKIYPLVTGLVGGPVFTDYHLSNVADYTNAPINIVLYPINKNAGLITGGYFYANDFINKTGDGGFKYSNEGAIVYIDVSEFFGQDDISNNHNGLGVRGTLAHEFQHLVNYTYILSKYGSLVASDKNSNGSPARRRNTWLNEGISGYVEKEYFKSNGFSMTKSHLQPFIADIIYDSVGFVPTDAEWSKLSSSNYSSSARPYILSAYGSTAVLMQEFAKMGGNVPGLLNTTLVGYDNSLKDVGAKSKQGSFDEFFKEAALATGVSSPSGYWVSATGLNLWQYRLDMTTDNDPITKGYQYDQFDGFAGVRQINGTVSYNSAKRYNSQVFLTAPIGTGYDRVTFTLPANLKGSYYLVSVTDSKTDASTAEEWIDAEKAPILIENGVGYDVGVNNRFAVVAVNTSSTVRESFTYALSTNRPRLEVTATPDVPLISGTGGSVTLTMKAIPSAIRLNPKPCDLEVIGTDANGAVVAGITADSALNMDETGTTTGTVVFDGTVPAGAYTLTVQEKGDDMGYIGSTTAAVMVNFNLALQSPGEGAVNPSTLTAITVKTTHNGDKMAVATGRFTLTVNGDAYTATAAGSTAYSETLSIPLTSFRNESGDNALIPYGAVVTLSTEVGSVGGETGAVNANTAIGSFTAIAEGSDPSLIPGALSFDKTAPGFANFLVYFGDNSGYTEATVTSNNTSVVTVEPADISQSGSLVKVVAHDADSTTLTIGFSGNDGELQTSLTMNVTVNGEKNNTGGGVIIRPGGNSGGGGGGGGGSSSGGSGGGGGGGGSDPFKPLTTTQAAKDATTAITKAAKANDKTATVRFNNISDISLETMKSMATLAEKAGVALQVNVHTMVNGKTVMRQSFNPANATKPVKFGGSTTSGRAVGAASVFKKYFTNTTEIMALNQKDDFGMVVETAILTGSAVEKTVIYSHNGAKNQFKPLENPKTWKDKSGYLHFETSLAYNYVLSQGTLTKK